MGQSTLKKLRYQGWATFKPVDWLRYFGLLIWLLAVFLLLLLPMLAEQGSGSTQGSIGLAWGAALVFVLVLWHPVFRSADYRSLIARCFWLGLLALAAFCVSFFSASGVGSLLAMVVAAFMPWFLPLIVGVVAIFLIALSFGLLVVFIPEGGWLLGVVFAVINLGLILFPFLASQLALAQVRARAELRWLNSELMATQSLLAENTRVAERVRISRDLHDLVGHHLTALSLNLEVASHLSQGEARQHVEQARSLARLLLSDVREVVNDMRREDQVDLGRALKLLADGVPAMRIQLDIPPHLSVLEPRRAQVLLRCAQELITNSAKHARATELTLSMESSNEGIVLQAQDNGLGCADLVPGNGLLGMRERLKEVGGRLEISTLAGAGFRARAWLPVGEGA